MNDSGTAATEAADSDPEAPRFGPGARALIVAAIVLVVGGVYLAVSSGGDDGSDRSMPPGPYASAERVEVSKVAGLP